VSPRTYRLRLAKGDFKFAVAHFTLFGPGTAEPLHGHNYRVAVEIEGVELDEAGLLVDCETVKRRVREICAELDDRVLIPEASPWLEVTAVETAVDVAYGARRYRFPAAEVVCLPLANTSMELLARFFWDALADDLASSRLAVLAVEIEETEGQSCRYRAPLLP
jgi:6-pyruvoyltetrahydropterin/6-carboxytetrahydropterin synthase